VGYGGGLSSAGVSRREGVFTFNLVRKDIL
jgi:hypothetical protein